METNMIYPNSLKNIQVEVSKAILSRKGIDCTALFESYQSVSIKTIVTRIIKHIINNNHLDKEETKEKIL